MCLDNLEAMILAGERYAGAHPNYFHYASIDSNGQCIGRCAGFLFCFDLFTIFGLPKFA